ncbi:nucleotide exchange factor GrpE [Thiogranum longum]|jgi:molecular chaperone GrpE
MSNEEKAAPVEETDAAQEAQPATEQAANEKEAAGDTDLQALLTDARDKADEHWNQCLRLQAELENLRKRNERDLANAHKFALERFAAELLPVKDSLEMGVAAAEDEAADVSRLKEGSELTLKMLTAALEKFNILEINPLNESFNPEYHEAMSMQERADVAPNTVVTVVQKGYLLNERLVRPAMVIVSRAASESPGGKLNEQA